MNEQEKTALNGVLELVQKEIRSRQRGRLWKRIFWTLLILFFILGSLGRGGREQVAVIEIHGLIGLQEEANADSIISRLKRASDNRHTKAIILDINSPGGSPVQSAQVFRALRALKQKRDDLPIYAVISDVGASGGYYMAVGADKIYADPSSIVGSIGVISSNFGYGDLLEKLGLEARTFTAGKHKNFLNGAKELDPEEVKFLQSLLDDMHQQFIEAVKTGRGKKLVGDPDLFSGLFWTGTKAKELGLVDDLASVGEVVEREFNDLPRHYYRAERSFMQELQRVHSNGLSQGLRAALQTTPDLR